MRKKSFAILLLVFFTLSLFGQVEPVKRGETWNLDYSENKIKDNSKAWSADNIKIVYLEGPTLFVCDPDGLLSAEYKDSANYYLNKLHQEFDIQSVFVVANRIKDGDAFRMAQDIGNKYGVGYKDTRTGLVIVIAKEDRQFFIAPGKGLEINLPDTTCNNIANEYLKPNMQDGNVDLAVMQTCKGIYDRINGLEQKPAKHVDVKEPFWTKTNITIAAIIVLVLIAIVFLETRRRRKE